MPNASTKVSVTLDLIDSTSQKLRDVTANFEKLKGIAGSTGLGGAGQEADEAGKSFDDASKAAGGFTKALSGLGDATKTVLGASGLGRFGAVLGLSGGLAALGAATGIMVQGIRMAYEMERAATNVATRLTIGGGNITTATAALVAATKAVAPGSGYTYQQILSGGGSYQAASGAGYTQTQGALDTLVTYSKAFGVDIQQLGSELGGLSQFSSAGTASDAATLFGGAEGAGALGQRDAYRSLIEDTVRSVQTASAGGEFDLGATQRVVNSVAASGRFFNSDAGSALGVRALTDLGSGFRGPLGTALARQSGISYGAMMMGDSQNGRNIGRMLGSLQADYGLATSDREGEASNFGLLQALQQLVGPQEGTAIYRMAQSRGGRLAGLTDRDVAQAADADARRKQALATPSGDLDKDIADLKNALTNVGDKALPTVDKALDAVHDALIGNTGAVNTLAIAIGAYAALSAGRSIGGILGKLAGLGRGAAGAAGAAAEGAEAAEPALVAGVEAGARFAAGVPLALVGDLLFTQGGLMNPDSAGNSDEYSRVAAANVRQMRSRLLYHGVDAGTAAAMTGGKGTTVADAALLAIMGQESGGDPTIRNKDSGALGLYQFMPSTAVDYVGEDFNSKYGVSYDSNGHRMLSAAGQHAFLMNPALQRQTAVRYLAYLAKMEKSKGLHGMHYLAEGWYGGPDAMGDENRPGGGDYPTVGSYGSQVDARFQSLLRSGAFGGVSVKGDGDYTVVVTVKKNHTKRAPNKHLRKPVPAPGVATR